MRLPVCIASAVAASLWLATAGAARAQWLPTEALAQVPVVEDCDETGGDVAVSRLDPPTVYLCRRVRLLIRKRYPDAEHFYFVHEFGHIAQQTADEAAADCWAARQLAAAPNGRRALAAIDRLLRARADEASTRYGSPATRAKRIRTCAEGG